jgi:hypothetical protein
MTQNDYYLEVGCDLYGKVVINHPKIQQDERGGHITFTPQQARHLAKLLVEKADEAEKSPRAYVRRKHVDMRQFERDMLGKESI